MLGVVHLTLLPVEPRALVVPERLLHPHPLAVDPAVPQARPLVRQQQPRLRHSPLPSRHHVGPTPAGRPVQLRRPPRWPLVSRFLRPPPPPPASVAPPPRPAPGPAARCRRVSGRAYPLAGA